jgi:hypothetical protein
MFSAGKWTVLLIGPQASGAGGMIGGCMSVEPLPVMPKRLRACMC